MGAVVGAIKKRPASTDATQHPEEIATFPDGSTVNLNDAKDIQACLNNNEWPDCGLYRDRTGYFILSCRTKLDGRLLNPGEDPWYLIPGLKVRSEETAAYVRSRIEDNYTARRISDHEAQAWMVRNCLDVVNSNAFCSYNYRNRTCQNGAAMCQAPSSQNTHNTVDNIASNDVFSDFGDVTKSVS